MCDRKSSRRHAGKRESSSRSSESGSRSADGAAPEIPIVLPDGKEFRQLLAWVCGADLQVDATVVTSVFIPGAGFCMRRSVCTWKQRLSSVHRKRFLPVDQFASVASGGSSSALSTCLCELCHAGWLSPISLLAYLLFGEFAGNRISWLTLRLFSHFNCKRLPSQPWCIYFSVIFGHLTIISWAFCVWSRALTGSSHHEHKPMEEITKRND